MNILALSYTIYNFQDPFSKQKCLSSFNLHYIIVFFNCANSQQNEYVPNPNLYSDGLREAGYTHLTHSSADLNADLCELLPSRPFLYFNILSPCLYRNTSLSCVSTFSLRVITTVSVCFGVIYKFRLLDRFLDMWLKTMLEVRNMFPKQY